VIGFDARTVWHKDPSPIDADLIVVPGGFSYGDYLRCGAIARYSPVMRSVKAAAVEGRPVIGICNGFQILCESGLLPGALIRNRSLHFVCQDVRLRVESDGTPFTRSAAPGSVLKMPVAHGEGCYFADPETLARIDGNGQVIFRYVNAAGEPTDAANPNGSVGGIAGICNEARNVVGMMPHPERACEAILGGTDGRILFESALAATGGG
jgi:phosphoribosylformylglycinamidine synthase